MLALAAIAATWASVWVRAFLAYGISRSIDHCRPATVFDFRQPLSRVRAPARERGSVGLAQRFVGDRVIEKACAQAAPLLPYCQRQEAFVAQTVVILDRMAGIAVMRCRAGQEIGR